MNKTRRKKLNDMAHKLAFIKDELQDVLFEEQDCFDSMPENLQGSMRGEESEEAIDTMESLIDTLDEVIDGLESF